MTQTIPIDTPFITSTLVELVRTNSVNPTLDPSSPGEQPIADVVGRACDDLGLGVEIFETEPRRSTVLATLRGTGGGRSLMLNAHLDTVGVEGMVHPFSGERRGGRVYGRGAYDMKGSLAACLGAAKALVDAGVTLKGDLVLAGVADEEYSSMGTAAAIERVRVDGAIVTEPTQLDVCLAHKGYVWLKVMTEGRAAHGSRFIEGVDANMRMGRVLHALEALEHELRCRDPHPLVGPPSLHAALLSGGAGISTYAPSCELQIERRTIPGETPDDVQQEIQHIVDGLVEEDSGFAASVETFFARDPFEVSPDAAIVGALERAASAVLERAPKRVGDTPWMDAALLAAAGVETVVMGPAGAGAHAKEEWVDVESVVELAEILARAAMNYCGLAT